MQNGQYIATGLLNGEAQIPLPQLVLGGLTMKGIVVGSLVQLKRLVELVQKKPVLYLNQAILFFSMQSGFHARVCISTHATSKQ